DRPAPVTREESSALAEWQLVDRAPGYAVAQIDLRWSPIGPAIVEVRKGGALFTERRRARVGIVQRFRPGVGGQNIEAAGKAFFQFHDAGVVTAHAERGTEERHLSELRIGA